ncbi:type 1 glutamine amidotransferase [Halomonas sp. 328]|uniref:type 1 glutamine amidotransferase n=1 Tax=Halomonas sp. 328 TaxID=2776704 RepID=UPI0018A6FDEB|nr:type 1 glutamine amidotransferase [Halomonas sp. 328]MBF8222896.1 type 1 glutamine amidotransferase [Halomonas sp. 328]
MHIYFLQHHASLGPARLKDWLNGMGHSHNVCHLDEALPRLADCDALVLLDGPQSEDAPELARERKLVERALKGGKPLLGIGLGARLIARALGATVSRGTYPEVGWHPLTLAPESPFDLPERFEAFLWQSRIFGLPEEALPLGATPAGPLQGFAWDGGRVVGLQCHLESTAQSAAAMLALSPTAFAASSSPTTHLQTAEAILAEPRRFDRQAALLDRLLAQWLSR